MDVDDFREDSDLKAILKVEDKIIELYKLNNFTCDTEPLDVSKLADALANQVKIEFNSIIGKKFLPQLCNESACLRTGRRGDLFFYCYSCQTDTSCCLCGACFVSSIHVNHEYAWMTIDDSDEESVCDCGDTEAWSSDHVCSYHQPKAKKIMTPDTACGKFFTFFLKLCYRILSGALAVRIESSITPEQQQTCQLRMSDRVSLITEDKNLLVNLSSILSPERTLTGICADCPYKNMVEGEFRKINYSQVFCIQVLGCLLDSLYMYILSVSSDFAKYFGSHLCSYEIEEENMTFLQYLLQYKDYDWSRMIIQPDPWYRILLISLCSEPILKDKLCGEVLDAYKCTLMVPEFAFPIKTLPQMFTLQLFTVKSLQSKYFHRLGDLFTCITQVDEYLSGIIYLVYLEAGGGDSLGDKHSAAHKNVMDFHVILSKCLIFENLVFDDIQNMMINKSTTDCLEALKSTDMLSTITKMVQSHYHVIELLSMLCTKADRHSSKNVESPSRKSPALGRIKAISLDLSTMLEKFIMQVDVISNFLIQDEDSCLYAAEYFIEKYFVLSYEIIQPIFNDPGFKQHVISRKLNYNEFEQSISTAYNATTSMLKSVLVYKDVTGNKNINTPISEFLHLCGVLQPISNMVLAVINHGKSVEQILNSENYKWISAIYSYKLMCEYTDIFLTIESKIFKRNNLLFETEDSDNLKMLRSGDILMGLIISDGALLGDLASKSLAFNLSSNLEIIDNLKFNQRLAPYLKFMQSIILEIMGTRFSSAFSDVAHSQEIIFRLVKHLKKSEIQAKRVQLILGKIALSYPGEKYSREEVMAHLKDILTSAIPDMAGEEEDFLKIDIQHSTVKLCLPFSVPDAHNYVTATCLIPKYSSYFSNFLECHTSKPFVDFCVWLFRSYLVTKDEVYGELVSVVLNFLQAGIHCKDQMVVNGRAVDAGSVLRTNLTTADTLQIGHTSFQTLLAKLAEGKTLLKCKIKSLYKDLSQAGATPVTDNSDNKENILKRKERILQKRELLLQKMKKQQASFMASVSSEDLEEDKIDRKRSKEETEEDVCIVCLQSATEADNDMVYPYHIVVPADITGNRPIKKNTCHAPMKLLHASSCCHVIHRSCIDKHIKGKLSQIYYEDDAIIVRENLFQCPLCQTVSNCLIKVYEKSSDDVKKSKLKLEDETFPEIILSSLKQNWEKKTDVTSPYSNEIKFLANLNKSQKITCNKIHLQSVVYLMSYTVKSICDTYSFTTQRNISKDYLHNVHLLIIQILESNTPICDSFFTSKSELGKSVEEDNYAMFHQFLTWFYCYKAAGIPDSKAFLTVENHLEQEILLHNKKLVDKGSPIFTQMSSFRKYYTVLANILEIEIKKEKNLRVLCTDVVPDTTECAPDHSVNLINLPTTDISIITSMTLTKHKTATCDGCICLCLVCNMFLCDYCHSTTPEHFKCRITTCEEYAKYEFEGQSTASFPHKHVSTAQSIALLDEVIQNTELQQEVEDDIDEDDIDNDNEGEEDTAATFRPRDILFRNSNLDLGLESKLTKHAQSVHNGVGVFLIPETSKIFMCSLQHGMSVYVPSPYKDQFNANSNCEKTLHSEEYEKMRSMFKQHRIAQMIIDSKQQ